MDAFRESTNEGPSHPPPMSPSQPQMQSLSSSSSQLGQAKSHRVSDEELFGLEYPLGFDLQNLNSCFDRLSVFDPSVRPPVPDTHRRSNRLVPLENQGGYWAPHREPQQISQLQQRFGYSNGSGNGYYGYDGTTSQMLNNVNSRDVPYLSRNRVLDQRPWSFNNGYGSGGGINNLWVSNDGFAQPPENGRAAFAQANGRAAFAQANGRGSVVALAKDQVSYLQLQKLIDEGSRETIDKIFQDVILHISDLMVDPFAHHVIQKLLEKCSSQQITQILDTITLHQFQFVRTCTDPLGTRTIQTLLKCLHSEDQILHIVEAISRVALSLTRSNNAKHVILQCFNQFTPSQNRILQEVIVGSCAQIATDQHGCCMLQQCLGINCDQLKHRLTAKIIDNALKLCVDCYGNYVVQYVVELEDHRVTADLLRSLIGHYGYLSRNKYGSHAVQKLLKVNYMDPKLIVLDLLREIDTLLLDPFGNYVIQTAWSVSKDDVRHLMWCHMNNNIQLMSCNKFGRKVLEKLNLQNQR